MLNNKTDYFDDDIIEDNEITNNNNKTSISFDDDFEDIKEDKPKVQIPETPEEREEREIERDTIIRGYNRLKLTLYSIVAIIIISIFSWLWLRYFSPYTTEAMESGRIMEMKCQGHIFKTYEGMLLSEKYIDVPDKWLEYDFPFSVANDSIARQIMRLKGSGKRVTLTYEEYKGTVFWRGNSHRIITGVEVADKDK